MDTKQIAHDLTVALAAKEANDPKDIATAYNRLLPLVQAEVEAAAKPKSPPKLRIPDRSKLGI